MPASEPARAPPGEVVYAIGDIHGRADLLRDLLRRIEADWAATTAETMRLVTLGDYIDRGPDSRGVIDLLMGLKAKGGERMTALCGNHEAALLEFIDEPVERAAWMEHYGRETLASYGVEMQASATATRDALLAALPPAHIAFLRALPLSARIGDYLFVHAGLRPGLGLEAQAPRDLLWIRGEFHAAPPWLDQVVVHGHTPRAEPETTPARIGIDTGAYATGVLTALRLEGADRRFLQTDA